MNDENRTLLEWKDDPIESSGRQGHGSAGLVRGQDVQSIAIAATFTADPLLRPLTMWMEMLDIAAEVTNAQYAQVMQELLNPHSVLCRNKNGFNVVLVRAEDWIRERKDQDTERNIAQLRRAGEDLIAAMQVHRSLSTVPALVFLCPTSSYVANDYRQPIVEVQQHITTAMRALTNVHIATHAELMQLYAVEGHEDAASDRLGHIPYTQEYFAALGTLLARRFAALVKTPCKVIALDCDNTLWSGVCGEDGPTGIQLTPSHIKFQQMLVRQHDAGVLLCLCSKNNPQDVEAVFDSHPQMPLQRRHVISSRVNWNPKSSNLRSLAQELNLGLDSFVFVDDSALECAEVQAHCPAVLTLQFPSLPDDITHFTDHVWAFDRMAVTEDAKLRTEKYRQNLARNKALEEATDLQKFLASLELKVIIAPMQAEQLARVAELIQRTNQFNLTAVRRRHSEIESLWRAGTLQILVVHVEDRFGDYGLVGSIFFRRTSVAIQLDTFVLSCRVLGRGVEQRIVNELGRIAQREGVAELTFTYKPTSKNIPARSFLETAFEQFRIAAAADAEAVFVVPAQYALNLDNDATADQQIVEEVTPSVAVAAADSPSTHRWHEVAYGLSRLPDIVRLVNRSSLRVADADVTYVAPRTPMEQDLAAIWTDVLGVDEVSVVADFLELGGNSLLAVQAIARIESGLGLELSVYEFLERPTIEAIAEKLADAAHSDASIQRIERSGPLALSWSQHRLWFIDQLEGGSTAYHVPVGIHLYGQLDRTALHAALDAIIDRHESLRTVFVKVAGEPAQQVLPGARFELQVVDLRSHGEQQREALSRQHSREAVVTAFDLAAGPLIRGRLLRLTDDDHLLLITMHHIVSDGWSIEVLIRELTTLYQAHQVGGPDPLAPLPIQYADYAQWQRRWLAESDLQKQLTHWKEHLHGAPALLDLPVDRVRPLVQSYRGENSSILIGRALTAELKSLSRRFNLTLAMTLYAAWTVVLARLSGQGDIVVGMPVANRRRTEIEGLIGFFVNTLAVRVRLEDDPTVSELFRRARETMVRAYEHQDVPFEQVVEVLQPARSMSHSPIFQVMFVLQNAPRNVVRLQGLELVQQEVPLATAQFDLTLTLKESEEGIAGVLNYASDLFDASTIERWAGYYLSVLQAMVDDPQRHITELSLLSESERRQVIDLSRSPLRDDGDDHLIHELFEERVRIAPDSVAAVFERQTLSYAELNRRANQLARHLKALHVMPDQLVAICVERGLEMLVGVLGILKAGAAYVPLDPDYPSERLSYMLADASPRVLLTQRRLRERLPFTSGQVVLLDDDWAHIGCRSEANLSRAEAGTSNSNLAYVIYTSGSTGNPKGVMIEHRNVTRLFSATSSWFRFGEQDVWTLFHSYAFDFSVWELWGALFYGGRVVVVPYLTSRSPGDFYQLLCDAGVTVLNQTPSAFSQLIEAQARSPQPHALRVVIFGGEALEQRMLRPWVERNGAERPLLVNMYGITETTVHVTHRRLTQTDVQSERASVIGEPIPDLTAYLLDSRQQPVPIGVAGELYVGGKGLARGYLNRPELTAQRFIADHLGDVRGERLYKTGDLGRRRADGSLEYIGRNDHQVKIRGYRIELGEVEAHLMRHALVKEALVMAREDVASDKRLVAYVTYRNGRAPDPEQLRDFAKGSLPAHMVPSAFVTLDSLPLTPTGKLDRRALPVPDIDAFASREYVAPRGVVEETLAQIWKELLHVERIGRDDGFFELGGHSLLATRVISHISDRMQVDVPLRELFNSPVLMQLSAFVEAELHGVGRPERTDEAGRDLRETIDEMEDEAVTARIAELENELSLP